jgi:NAD(P)H-nitrite reductase large subunit
VLSDQHAVNRLRLLVSDCAIVGAVVIGDQAWSRPLHHLIAAKADICSIRAQLEAEPAQALTMLSNFYQHWEQSRCASTNV